MSLPKNLKLTDLILKEPVDFKAMGQPDQVKYQRHRRRTSYTGGESVAFTVGSNKRNINPEKFPFFQFHAPVRSIEVNF